MSPDWTPVYLKVGDDNDGVRIGQVSSLRYLPQLLRETADTMELLRATHHHDTGEGDTP